MTDDLSLMMRERAEGADLLAPDLASITAAGRRRVRRRRGAAVVCSVAALGLLGSATAVLSGGTDRRSSQLANDTAPNRQISYAEGGDIHTGDTSLDVGHQVRSYVTTSYGVVLVDQNLTVWAEERGRFQRVGAVSEPAPRLVADDDGGLVGWIDTYGDAPGLTVLDLASGDTYLYDIPDGADRKATRVEAIDDRFVFWDTPQGQQVIDLDGATQEPATQAQVLAAQQGTVVFAGEGGAVSIRRPDGTTTALKQVFATIGQLSPDAAYVNLDADSPAVYATDTGRQVHLDIDGFFADGYQWLDDHTLAVLALATKRSDWQLLTCTVPDGACTVVIAHLGNPYDEKTPDPGFVVPIGTALGGD